MSGSRCQIAAPAFRDMIDKMNNGARIAILGIAPAGFEIDWNQSDLQDADLEGHLWPRDVRDPVQDDRAGSVGPRCLGSDHPPAQDRGFRRQLRRDARGSGGKVVMDWVWISRASPAGERALRVVQACRFEGPRSSWPRRRAVCGRGRRVGAVRFPRGSADLKLPSQARAALGRRLAVGRLCGSLWRGGAPRGRRVQGLFPARWRGPRTA